MKQKQKSFVSLGHAFNASYYFCLISSLIRHPSSLLPGGFLSVALSRPMAVQAGVPKPLPGVGVTHRRALWSPDFPPLGKG